MQACILSLLLLLTHGNLSLLLTRGRLSLLLLLAHGNLGLLLTRGRLSLLLLLTRSHLSLLLLLTRSHLSLLLLLTRSHLSLLLLGFIVVSKHPLWIGEGLDDEGPVVPLRHPPGPPEGRDDVLLMIKAPAAIAEPLHVTEHVSVATVALQPGDNAGAG